MLLASVHIIKGLPLLIDPFGPPVLAAAENEYSGGGGTGQLDIVRKNHFACLRGEKLPSSRHGSLIFDHRMTKVHLGARKNRETAGIPVVSSSRTHAILLGVEHGIH